MLAASIFGNQPGQSAVVETYEAAVNWGRQGLWIFSGEEIASTISDPTNSPTYELRQGLVVGKIAATGLITNYAATNTDGSEVAYGILPVPIRMQDVFTGVNTIKFYKILVGGPIQAANLIGLDNMARAQLAARFIFDDDLIGRIQFPWRRFQTKVTSYQVTVADNLNHFDTLGAVGAVVFTLPPIANGLYFGFHALADQNMTITSSEGTNIVAFNNLSATSVAFTTGGQKIGGGMAVYSNPAGTKWIAENLSAGANTVTVA